MEQIDCVIAGAGVVGLAIARELAQQGIEALIIEKNGAAGLETSARNSEVIHAGLYYPKNSLKKRLCIEGRLLLLEFLKARQIPHRLCGKLIVGNSHQFEKLENLHRTAKANGLQDLQLLSRAELTSIEPEVVGIGAIWSPNTGIFDSSRYLVELLADFSNAGGNVCYNTSVTSVQQVQNHFVVTTLDKDSRDYMIKSRMFVNAAGLGAGHLAAAVKGGTSWSPPHIYFAKGNYYSVDGTPAFSHLVYPLPEPGGLGIHSTVDLQGAIRFGPDVEWVAEPTTSVNSTRAETFKQAISQYWPAIEDRKLCPLFSGVRPKLNCQNQPDQDFMIAGPTQHGCPRLVQLFGIESPGLTSSMSIAKEVTKLLLH